jgi:hypothetical protein
MAIRALAAGTIPVYSGEAEPVSDVTSPKVMVFDVTPGALAVKPEVVAPVEAPGEAAPAGAVVAVELPLLELPHAATVRPATETRTAFRITPRIINIPLVTVPGQNRP